MSRLRHKGRDCSGKRLASGGPVRGDWGVPGYADGGRLSSREREQMPKSDFVYPGARRYPIPDEAHARNALARVSQNGTSAEKRRVRAAVRRKYPGIEIGDK